MDDQSVKKKAPLTAQRSGSQMSGLQVPGSQKSDAEIAVVPVRLSAIMRPRPAGGVAEIVPLGTTRIRQKPAFRKEAPKMHVDEHIGRHLKAVYDDVLNQPIPDRFLDLLNQLGTDKPEDRDTEIAKKDSQD